MNSTYNCPDCGRKLHLITMDDVIELDEHVLLIKDLPVLVCGYPECETRFHSGEVLMKRDLLIHQFKRQIKNTISNREVVITYPKSLFN